MSHAQHVVGIVLLLTAFSSMAMISYLPTRGPSGIDLPFLADVRAPVALAFAGYPGCGSVCPTTLAMMSEAYGQLGDARQSVEMLFINVHLDTPDPVTDNYARAFHPDFRGFTASAGIADELYRRLSLRTYESLQDAAAHTGFVYLFARHGSDWRIERVYRRTPGAASIRDDIRTLVAGL